MMKALYAGSFDPPTKGHKDIIKFASTLCQEIVVGVARNDDKKPMFSAEERVAMLQDMTQDLGNVEVISYAKEITVRVAERVGASVLIRGMRDEKDAYDETKLCYQNQTVAPEVRTLILPAQDKLRLISSSFLKGLADYAAWEEVLQFSSPFVLQKLKEKYEGE